jgi:hypothetical protein
VTELNHDEEYHVLELSVRIANVTMTAIEVTAH